MPRLLEINVSCNWGSTGRIAEQIGLLARCKGWNVSSANGTRYHNPSEIPSYLVSTSTEEKMHGIYSMLFDAQGLGSVGGTKKLIKHIKEIKPDVIHLHILHGYYINYDILFRYLKDTNIPVVWTLHDCWAFTGHCVYFERAKCSRWKTECYNCPQKNEFPRSIWLDKSRQNFKRKRDLYGDMRNLYIVPVSYWLGNLAKESFLKGHNIQTIYNGVDTSVFQPVECDFRKRHKLENKKILLAVAQGFDERKGVRDYAELCSMLTEEYKIVLIGADEKDKKLLPDDILVLPKTENIEQLVGIYSTADVLLSLSYEETFGLTPVEAMACGTPAIVYDNTAQPEHITPETGVVVETGNLEMVKNAVETICANGKYTYRDNCRQRACTVYDKDKCYEEYIKLFMSILKNNEKSNNIRNL